MQMKTLKIIVAAASLAALTFTGIAPAAPVSFTDDLNTILSKLQSMGGDSYPQSEWTKVYRQIDDVESRAKAAQSWDDLVQVRVIRAMVLGDMQKNYQGAVDLLKNTQTELAGKKNVPSMKKVYVKLAEMYGKLGDAASVNRVMEEFRASPYYDAQKYAFSGGNGPKDPIVVARPLADVAGSITETSMKVAQTQAGFAVGGVFPDFSLKGADGSAITKQSLGGKVVLVDFWNKNWTAWQRDLANLAGTYARFNGKGFEIVGINIDSNAGDFSGYLKANKMIWPEASDGRDLTKQLGLFGVCANYLLDKNGVIIGRDLHGADLNETVKRALAR